MDQMNQAMNAHTRRQGIKGIPLSIRDSASFSSSQEQSQESNAPSPQARTSGLAFPSAASDPLPDRFSSASIFPSAASTDIPEESEKTLELSCPAAEMPPSPLNPTFPSSSTDQPLESVAVPLASASSAQHDVSSSSDESKDLISSPLCIVLEKNSAKLACISSAFHASHFFQGTKAERIGLRLMYEVKRLPSINIGEQWIRLHGR